MYTKLLALFFPFLLVSCASVNGYQEPRTGTRSLATVSGSSTRSGLFEWSNNIVSSIDNKPVGMVWSENSKINVVPGPHLFVISSTFNRGFGTGPYDSLTEVRANLQPNASYRFVSSPQGAVLHVWAVDSKGKRISEIGASQYHYAPPAPAPIVYYAPRR
ncbi:hypothetical protein AQUSIP_18320 [Aquicella siphonis]|uniref:Lipoprotein n=1 Tax=Aquicella siphonis TaxID=254247 RepID=A0A5E4PHN5_9COXI|nr:hypothetical protein [Aquicella siphonis]VVC76519.1 hypothetical protein AQUSIP_18320 [Aquicella siphonis]